MQSGLNHKRRNPYRGTARMIGMTLKIALLVATAAIAACSASPSGGGQSVPRNSPLEPNIVNIPATIGRANLEPTAPPFAIAGIGQFEEPFGLPSSPTARPLVTEKIGPSPDAAQGREGRSPRSRRRARCRRSAGRGGLLDVAYPHPDLRDQPRQSI